MAASKGRRAAIQLQFDGTPNCDGRVTLRLAPDVQKYRKRCKGMFFLVYQTNTVISDPAEFAKEMAEDPLVRIVTVG